MNEVPFHKISVQPSGHLEKNHFEPLNPLNTAVLLLIFNRPEITRQVFNAIRKAKPPRLYVAADGPRENIENEVKRCDEARLIIKDVDWECEVKTLFRDINLGCSKAVSSAIDWFFENESEGIVLEDDCLPSPSFFWYCQDLIKYYENDERIMAISGNNFQEGNSVTADSYYFSRYNHCCGWASWRRAWKHYDHNMIHWAEFKNDHGLIAWSGGNRLFERYWNRKFNSTAAGQINSWAYRWTFACWIKGGLTCLPEVNLISNLGFGEGATHTTKPANELYWKRTDISFPLRHPKLIIRNTEADHFTDKNYFGISALRELISTIKDRFPFLVSIRDAARRKLSDYCK